MSVTSKCESIGIPVYGFPNKDSKETESAHMVTFFNLIRMKLPSIGKIATHIRNEGKRSFNQASNQKAQGMVAGASDIIIPGAPSFVCEMKSMSPNASITKEQIDYLQACKANGAFVCVALGWEAAWKALEDWINR